MTKPLWAPWRLEYIQQADELDSCVFCIEARGALDEAASLLVQRGESAIAILNKYPVLFGPSCSSRRSATSASSAELTDAEALELHRLAVAGVDALASSYGPAGFNLGWNLGRAAGAGIADHVHLHVVPRWFGDTNFMPVLADVKVLPEHLLETRDRLRAAWPTRRRDVAEA